MTEPQKNREQIECSRFDLDYSRVLLLGSGPDVPRWWADHGQRFQRWTIGAINNAWAVVDPLTWLDAWFVSSDFHAWGSCFPSPEAARRLRAFLTAKPRIVDPGRRRKVDGWQNKLGGGTMFVCVAWGLLERALDRGLPECTVAVAGSDFDYSGKTHFYGAGKASAETHRLIKQHAPELAGKAADPLRFGTNYLRAELLKVQCEFEAAGYRIVNVGQHEPTLLPFPRAAPEEIAP